MSIENTDGKELMKHISTALNTLGYLEGVKPYGEEVTVSGGSMDACLLAITMSKMIEVGDLEIKLIDNTYGKKDYFYKLLSNHSWEQHQEADIIKRDE